jgi:hypothetical protein
MFLAKELTQIMLLKHAQLHNLGLMNKIFEIDADIEGLVGISVQNRQ